MIDASTLLPGQRLSRVEQPSQWVFDFMFERARLQVECLWRISDASRVLRTSHDDNQKFGLSAPVDAAADANAILCDLVVKTASIRGAASDLLIEFQSGVLLELLADSSGYEAWSLSHGNSTVVAQGGGKIVQHGA